MEKQKKAVYVLSADPIHYGHVHNLAVAVNSGLFEHIYVAVGNNPVKKYLFNQDERVFLARKTLESSGLDLSKLTVEGFTGLSRNYAVRKGIDFIVRGSRNGADFEYEKLLADYHLKYGLTTFVVPADGNNVSISSTFVKAIALEAGMTHDYVHSSVKQALEERLRGISLVGVTGNMGVGKTTFCKNLVQYAETKDRKLKINHLDFDRLVHSMYSGDDELSKKLLRILRDTFGEDVFDKEKLSTKRLASVVFGSNEERKKLAEILARPSLMRLEDRLAEMKGIVLVDAAYLVEYNMLGLVNNNTLLLNCNENERYARVLRRDGLTREELEAKVRAQYPYDVKKQKILGLQAKAGHGFFLEVSTDGEIDYESVLKSFDTFFPLLKSGGVK